MNTRLQVEHPVTEEVTGLDLVEQMIRVAAGEKLAFAQDDVKLDGWAIETRVYAEDPYRGFLPSTGRLVRYWPPSTIPSPRGEGRGVGATAERRARASSDHRRAPALSRSREEERRIRVDDGVAEGGEVSMFYDPMIAKLITWAPTREAAIDAQVAALDQFVIDGIGDNVDFLSALMQHPRFRAGDLTTGFIAEEYPDGFHGAPADEQLIADLAVIAGMVAVITDERAAEIDGQLGPPIASPCERVGLRSREQRASACGSSPTRAARSRCSTAASRSTSSDAGCRGSGCCASTSTAATASSRCAAPGRGWELQTRGASAQGAGAAAPRRRAVAAHDREGPAGPVAAAAGADAGAADAGSTSRSATRSRPASRSR